MSVDDSISCPQPCVTIVLPSGIREDGLAEMDSYFEKRPDGRILCRFESGEEQLAREFLAQGPAQPPFEHPRRGDIKKLTIGAPLVMLLLSPLFGSAVGDDLSDSLQTGLVLATGLAICMALLGRLIRGELIVIPAKERLECGATLAFEQLVVPRRTVRMVVAADRTEPVSSEHVVVTTDVAVSIGRNATSHADEIATKLNEALFEFEERRAVRAWLRQREHALADRGPYRRT